MKHGIIEGDSLRVIDSIIPKKKFKGFFPLNDDYYPGFISKDYIFWFEFATRDKLIVTDKAMTKIVGEIPFKGTH